MYVDPSVFGREDLMVFYRGDWKREDALKALALDDVAFVTWKLDGGLSIQLWPKDHRKPVNVLSAVMGARPSGQTFTERHSSHSMSPADWRILDALVDDPTMPFEDVVARTGLSAKTVRKYLQVLLHDETIFVMPRLGSLADSGEVLYHLAVTGKVGIADLRRALGEAFVIGDTNEPPMKYLLCRANDLADVTARTQAARKLVGVESVEVTLNRELLVARGFVHSLIQEKINEWESSRRPRNSEDRRAVC